LACGANSVRDFIYLVLGYGTSDFIPDCVIIESRIEVVFLGGQALREAKKEP
jgi:hypothetical protein